MLRRFVRPTLWKSRLGRETLLTRLIRRYMAEGTSAGLDSVARLLKAAPDDSARDRPFGCRFSQGWREAPRGENGDAWKKLLYQHELAQLFSSRWQAKPDDLTLLQLSMSCGHVEAANAALLVSIDSTVDVARRVAILEVIAEHIAGAGSLEPLYSIVNSDEPEAVRIAALKSLSLGERTGDFPGR